MIIPKVASSTMSDALENQLHWGAAFTLGDMENEEWVKAIYPNLPFKKDHQRKILGLVRHPITRWCSGIVQYYSGIYDIKDAAPDQLIHISRLVREDTLWEYLEEPVHDNHTRPQWLDLVDVPRLNLFRLGHMDHIWPAMGIEKPYQMDGHLHDHRKQGLQGIIVDRVMEIITLNDDYKSHLRRVYRKDMELYHGARRRGNMRSLQETDGEAWW